jgi:hypothetical protein
MLFWKDYVGEDTPRARARRRGTDFINSGLLAQGVGSLIVGVVANPLVLAFWLGLLLIAMGVPALVVGCTRRGASKGYGPVVGGGLGLLGIFGVLALIALPDRTRPRHGFEVVRPLKVSTAWAPPDEDPRWNPRSWGEDEFRQMRP